MSKEEELGIGKDRRKVDMNEEYYRLAAKVSGLGASVLFFVFWGLGGGGTGKRNALMSVGW